MDIGQYQLPKMHAPTDLIQIMPTEMFGRPATTISSETLLLKGYLDAPGIVTPAVANDGTLLPHRPLATRRPKQESLL